MADKPANNTTKTPIVDPQAAPMKGGVQLHPSMNGNELYVMVQMLEAINKNIAFLATTIHNHLHPKKEEPKKDG